MPRAKKQEVKEEAVEPVASIKEASIDGPGIKCDRAQPGSDAARQLEYFASQPTVRTRIPKGPGEKAGSFETVIVNGLRINILKGVSVDLPEGVAQIIEDAFYITDQAINETKIANPFTGQKKPLRVDSQSDSDKEAY